MESCLISGPLRHQLANFLYIHISYQLEKEINKMTRASIGHRQPQCLRIGDCHFKREKKVNCKIILQYHRFLKFLFVKWVKKAIIQVTIEIKSLQFHLPFNLLFFSLSLASQLASMAFHSSAVSLSPSITIESYRDSHPS